MVRRFVFLVVASSTVPVAQTAREQPYASRRANRKTRFAISATTNYRLPKSVYTISASHDNATYDAPRHCKKKISGSAHFRACDKTWLWVDCFRRKGTVSVVLLHVLHLQQGPGLKVIGLRPPAHIRAPTASIWLQSKRALQQLQVFGA